MTFFLTILLTLCSSVLYRMGGATGYNTKFRDLGCPTCATLAMLLWFGWAWTLIPCFLLLFGSMTTYWKKKGTEAHWYNWLLTGLGYSVSLLPWIIQTHDWTGFALRTFVLTGLTTVWKTYIFNAVVSELGMGALVILTIPILAIGKQRRKK